MKIHKIAKIFIILFLMLNSLKSFAGNFGSACADLPFTPDSDLMQTAYGFIKLNINGQGWSDKDYCDASVNSISYAAYDTVSSIFTNKITIKENETRNVFIGEKGGSNVIVNLTATRQNNLLCLFMPTPRGLLPVICKQVSYTPTPPPDDDSNCSNIGESCYQKESRSQSLLNFSGLAVDCLTETLNKVFFTQNTCAPTDQNVEVTNLTTFPVFQGYLKNVIGAALVLYTMFFGMNMILNQEYSSPNKIMTFIIKLLFVVYFAIGLGPVSFQTGKPTQENGMLTYALPLLSNVAPEFAQIVFNAGGAKGLCTFDITKYPKNYQFYALWDSIDCRVGYYLGMDLLYNIDKSGVFSGFSSSTGSTNGSSPIPNLGTPDGDSPNDLSKVGSLKFFTVMFGFFMSGNIIIVIAGLVFAVIFTSIILYFITHYLVCLVTLYVMIYISPIFVPMILFERTKAYFDSWLKICFSCALQPAVVAGFISLLLTMYDSAIFKNCEFLRHDYEGNNIKFSTFELRLPENDPTTCQESFGYKLQQYYSGQGWKEHLLILVSIKSIDKDVASILAELLCVLVFSIIFYYFSKSIGQFASDLTSGPVMDSVTASPAKIVNLVKQGANFVKDAAMVAQGKPPGGGGDGGGAQRSVGAQASDILSGG